ncbi:ABC transporter ATP-binding protein [Mesorhizobium sp. B3-1-3]|uniref:ABC transporter ATP-binding protein n=1 Tax=unclassified Mesorhizobium TaxID=325217 RepID=UPI00112D5611|nr:MULTISPECIES: ABC transporter ATP-binding protein [unclassified Mesorhizobium]TPI56045.1 ABC transporter ATP-binding protein [Mesorhizobium sp. B3-1-8]TPI63339.1 ABC transporter ATP-binding protein [Mesorhizobium sp. B3-1-3]
MSIDFTARTPAGRVKGKPILEIKGLKIDGLSDNVWSPIIKGIDLNLNAGEVLGLIGESGAGKSTLGLAAMGYARPGCRVASGCVVFDGMDLLKVGEARRRAVMGSRIAYVAQSAAASFNPAHRLIEQTIETALDRKIMLKHGAEADARNLFKLLRLPNPDEIGFRFPHQVSGGQLQRAMIAMAMSCRPDIIVFDEPTTALDVTTQVEVLASMRDIVDRFHTAAIYITHDLAVVAQMAHRIMVLRNGLLVEEATTRQILSAPKAEYTKSLWAVRKLEKPERTGEQTLLELRGIDAYYGTAKVLDDVSVKVPKGRTVAVVGESGSGKSTLARVIAGLLAPSKGDIEFSGKPLPGSLRNRDRNTLRQIQMIYQSADTSLNPRHSVGDIIGRPLEFYQGVRGQERDRRVLQILDMIELGERLFDRLPAELSGGQKQRVSLARALAAEPQLIICDEVTSALDQIVQEEILTLLMRIQRECGTSYLFITHDIATVRAVADQVVVMLQGRVVDQGPKSRVLLAPYAPYTELLLSSVPEMDSNWLTNLLASRKQAM